MGRGSTIRPVVLPTLAHAFEAGLYAAAWRVLSNEPFLDLDSDVPALDALTPQPYLITAFDKEGRLRATFRPDLANALAFFAESIHQPFAPVSLFELSPGPSGEGQVSAIPVRARAEIVGTVTDPGPRGSGFPRVEALSSVMRAHPAALDMPEFYRIVRDNVFWNYLVLRLGAPVQTYEALDRLLSGLWGSVHPLVAAYLCRGADATRLPVRLTVSVPGRLEESAQVDI